MMRIGICDDVKEIVKSLYEDIYTWAMYHHVNVEIKKIYSGEDLLCEIQYSGCFDVIFLDVELGSLNGLEVARAIRKTDNITKLIFISSHHQYYKEAYEVQPFQFLDKPIEQNKLYTVLEQIYHAVKEKETSFSFAHQRVNYRVLCNDIIYFKSESRYVNIVCKGTSYQFLGKLDEVERILFERKSNFLRIHRSYLVNAKNIKEYSYENIVLVNGEELMISRNQRINVREAYKRFLER